MSKLNIRIFGLALALASSACGDPCKTVDSTPVAYSGGTRQGDLFLTTPWNGTWLDFPGGREYQVAHPFKTAFILPIPWVAFTSQPMPDNAVGNASLSPGNQSLIQAVNDRYVQVRNDTCEHFYLLLAIDGGHADDAGIGAAGAAN